MDETMYCMYGCGVIDRSDAGANDRALSWPADASAKFDRFGRLDLLGQYVLVSAERALLGELMSDVAGDRVGILLVSDYGSAAVDADFIATMDQREGASPMLFAHTLPSSASSALAMHYGITGENLCLQGGADSCQLLQSVELVMADARYDLLVLVAAVCYRQVGQPCMAGTVVLGRAGVLPGHCLQFSPSVHCPNWSSFWSYVKTHDSKIRRRRMD